MQNYEKSAIFDSFKEILKSRKISYKTLSLKTGLAESTVKRIFSLEECSISRLIELASGIDLSLNDLLKYAYENKLNSSSFSMEAEKFLAKNLSYFYFYRQLFYYKEIKELLQHKNYKKNEVNKYLKKLDSLNIIQWHEKDKIIFNNPSFLKLRDDGPLKSALYKDWFPKFNKAVLRNIDTPDHDLKIFSARLSEESRGRFMSDYLRLVDEILKTSSFEVKTKPQELRPFGVALAYGPYRVGLDLN